MHRQPARWPTQRTGGYTAGGLTIDKSLDIAVAGCGIAGMTAALLLAKDGHRVTIFERFDQPRPIGSGLMLQPTGLAVLNQLELAAEALRRGQRIDRLRGEADGRVVLDVRYSSLKDDRKFGVGIERSALFEILHNRLQGHGITVATGHEVIGIDGGSLVFEGTREGAFDLLIDALGTRSALAPAAGRDLVYGALWTTAEIPDGGFDLHTLSQRYRRASIMAGVLPLGLRRVAFFWSLRARDHAGWIEAGIDPWKRQVHAVWPAVGPILDQIDAPDRMTFARYAHKTLSRPVNGRLIHIGDSWHSASPQLGQGANMAMLDAWALAKALREQSDVDAALKYAVHMRRGHIRLYQMLTSILTPVYQSDSKAIPFIRDRLMGPMSKLWPLPAFQAALVSGLIGRPLNPLGIDFAPASSGR